MKLISASPFLKALKSLYKMQITALNVSITLPVNISVKKQQLLPIKKFKYCTGKIV